VEYRSDPAGFQAYARDENLARAWVRPGTPGMEHRIGGLEKDFLTGDISHDPMNHQRMVEVRAAKLAGIARDIPALQVDGPVSGDLLVVGWGSTCGSIAQARSQAAAAGKSVAHVHLRHLNPFPADLGEVMKRYRTILVPELNLGQLSRLLRERYLREVVPMSKVQGKPFKVSELYDRIMELC
jgi:2-oxoglutarate ferredoxin oxidoreductase subunit alpha